ncbi:SpoIIE family protein phosphatase [Streptomyces sp. NPDC001027]|uniref:SpoIIE family protein phosphatase n=1 Tax=Streptomyces sp. NPDC001027 TaxID=3154771 RepID=UPI0033241B95
MSGTATGPGNHTEGTEPVRLGLPVAQDEELDGAQVLRLAMRRAAAFLDGAGSLVHWRGPEPGRLRVVAACGQGVGSRTTLPSYGAFARAMRTGSFAWAAGSGTGSTVFGLAAVPLLSADGPIGALSVLTTTPGEPDSAHRASLQEVADWAALQLEKENGHSTAPQGQPAAAPPLIDSSLDRLLRTVPFRDWEFDVDSGSLAFGELIADPAGHAPRARGDPAGWRRVITDVRTAIALGAPYDTEYLLRQDDGTLSRARARGRLVRGRHGASDLVVGALWWAGRMPEPPSRGMQTLQTMREGLLIVSEDWRTAFVNEEAEQVLGMDRRLIGGLVWDGPLGAVPGLENACRRAAREGRTLSFALPWPSGRRRFRLRCVPARSGQGMAVHLVDVTDEDLQGVGGAADEALSVGSAVSGAALAAARTVRMEELTAALSEAVTSEDVVRVVAERVLPPLGADRLLVEILGGDHLHIAGAAGYPEALRLAATEKRAIDLVAAETLSARTPRFLESTAEFIESFPRLSSLAAASTNNAWALLPLIASGRDIGCCFVAFARSRSFPDDERTLLTALSGLVAQALERARLYDVEHTRAQELQRGLLPRELPRLASVRAAARYLPAGHGTEVGGDWYDVIPLSADRVAMVIGDVMGHGITEAATMGRLRTAVRTLADLEIAPDELLHHLNDIVSDLGEDSYATCLYSVFDPVARTLTYSTAGHPPPLVVRPDGTLHSPDVDGDPPLGAANPPFSTHRLSLPEESLVVLWTDGLVESAARDVDQGLSELRRTLSGATTERGYFSPSHEDGGHERLEDLCDIIVSALLPLQEDTNDDAALLIAHARCTAAQDIATCGLADDPRAAGQARECVRRQLAAWGLDDLVMTTELIVSEMVGNVIRHAKGPIVLRLLRSRSLICEVYDGSLTTPRIRRAGSTDEGGRGLHLIAALSRRWGTRYLDDGKCIWAEQDLPAPGG